MAPFLIAGITSYLLGSIPFGFLLVKFFLRQDIRASGSGNIGATNVARSGAKGLGILTLVLDGGKGYLAVVLARWIGAHEDMPAHSQSLLLALAVTVAIAGHVFPVWLGFRGGKGVATGLGAFLGLLPLAAFGSALLFTVIFALSRYVSLASIVSAAIFPLFAAVFYRPIEPVLLAAASLGSLLIIFKHRANIRRLLAGTENRFGVKHS